jgi:hypothetical protein
MNDELRDSALGRALGAYSRSLRQMQPSAALDARLAASIQEHAGVRQVRRPLWQRPMPWVAAIASVAVIATGVALLLMRATPPESSAQAQASDTPVSTDAPAVAPTSVSTDAPAGVASAPKDTGDRLAIPSRQYSLWPTEAAVFRVKASLGGGAESVPGERQYWVDVRVANDGSMRIVRVLPANPEE